MIFVRIATWLALTFCVIGLAVLPAFAHDWYSRACCSDKDCAAVAAVTVTFEAGGYRVRLEPGDHPMVGQYPIEQLIPYDEVLPSMDSDFHACIRDQSNPSAVALDPVICLYVPEPGGTS